MKTLLQNRFLHLLFLFVLTFFSLTVAHAQFSDNFSDGNFSFNPVWQGLDTNFEILASELHLNAPAVSGESFLSTPSQAMNNASWQFDIRMDFNTSSSNYARVFLSSDSANVTQSSNGYYLEIGRLNDEVSLYKNLNGNATKIIDGTDDLTNTSVVNISIRVTRSAMGNWELLVDSDGGSNNFLSQGTITDFGIGTSDYFGVICDYTSTRSDKFYFDNFIVTGTPGTPFTGNTTFGDIVFNEVMADPSPPQTLPDLEYLELFNASGSDIQMSNFTLVNTTTAKSLTSFSFNEGAHLIVCDLDDISEFSQYGNVLGVDGFSSLANGGDSLTLLNESNTVIDVLVYEDDWHANSTKRDGGWSLERINPFTSCASAASWSSSLNGSGGTPGQENSLFDENYVDENFEVLQSEVIDSVTVLVSFTDFISEGSSLQFNLTNGTPINISSFEIGGNTMTLNLASELAFGLIYDLSIVGLNTCDGLPFDISELQIAIPDQGANGDVIINEILFNPYTGGVDFVELFNNSDKNIAIGAWKLANIENDIVANQKVINPDGTYTLLARDYVLLSTNSANILEEYPFTASSKLWEMSNMPSYNNEEGSVVLISQSNEVYDRFDYNQDYHFELLGSFDGVSLERIFYNQPTNDPANWHSAAQSVGFATPGYRNSQAKDPSQSESELSLTSEVISPDNDGFNDQMLLNYILDEPGYLANVSVFDGHGNLVKEVANNELLATEGFFVWDGFSEIVGSKLSPGLYVVYAELFNLKGDVTGYKLPIAITYK